MSAPMTPDTRHDTRGYLGPCCVCGCDMWQGETVVETWMPGTETPQWAHENCEREGEDMQQGKKVIVTFQSEDDAAAFVVWARYAFDHYMDTAARELDFEERKEARRVFGEFARQAA